eukprot:823190-Lingulodinium_polyedra.AAC.1
MTTELRLACEVASKRADVNVKSKNSNVMPVSVLATPGANEHHEARAPENVRRDGRRQRGALTT